MWPIRGEAIAPPTIDITISDEPSFACSPTPRMPNAKIVGNPTDMKKNVANIVLVLRPVTTAENDVRGSISTLCYICPD